MVQWDPRADEPPRVLLVDLDGLKRTRRPSLRHELRALARLNVSLDHCKRVTLTDRLRFLKRYRARPGHARRPWKPIWQQIAARSHAKRKARARYQQKMLAKYGRF
jgi:hypothetical protein